MLIQLSSIPTGGIPNTTAEHSHKSFTRSTSSLQAKVPICVSLIITLTLHLAVFPASSVASYSKTVVPTGNILPGDRPVLSTWTTSTTPQLSWAIGNDIFANAPHSPNSAFSTTSGIGQLRNVGAILSNTTNVNSHVSAFPAGSVTTHSIIVSPRGSSYPLSVLENGPVVPL